MTSKKVTSKIGHNAMNGSQRIRRTLRFSGLVLVACALSLTAACQSGSDGDGTKLRRPRSEGRWTKAFLAPALLFAEEIRIEGPPALRSRLALPQNGESIHSVTKATDNGLLHVFTLRGTEGALIQAHLDRWQIVATRRLQVLERPGETNARIVASGEASWVPTEPDSAEPERRGAELTFVGELIQ